MYGETNHHASTIGVNVKFRTRFVKFDLAEIVLLFSDAECLFAHANDIAVI